MPPETQQLMEPPVRTPESLFEELVFRPVFEGYSRKLDQAGLTPMQRAEVYQRGLLRALLRQIQEPVLKEVLGDDYSYSNTQTQLKEVSGTPEFQQACEKKVREVAAESWQVYVTRSLIDVEIDYVKGT